MELQKGQKLRISDLTHEHKLSICVNVSMSNGEADITCFGVDAAGQLSDDRYFIFYNQTTSPEGAVAMKLNGSETVFTLDLDKLPDKIQKLVVTVAADGAAMRDISRGAVSIDGGGERAEFHFSGVEFQQEKALILCELYRKAGIWRYSVVSSGFNGGLEALLNHFGGKAAAPQPEPAPEPKPKVKLSKISLKKSGDTHKIDLSKTTGEIHANLNWNAGKKTFFGNHAIDLDLACMYRLKNGMQGVIQALGNLFGSSSDLPFILLDQDDRSGDSANGENIHFIKPELIDFAIVFAYIYDGVPNWRSTDARVVLKQKGSPDIEIHIDNPNSNERFCVLASLTGRDRTIEVKREEKFFSGHEAVDRHYKFGFRWVAGRK